MAANASDEQGHKVALTVLVDNKDKKKVLLAKAGKDFVDILLSFLTLPLGTITRLVAKESNMQPVIFGSLSSLSQSVADLDEKYLWTQTCKEMLLKPRNSMEAYCRQLRLNIDDTEPLQYLRCADPFCCGIGVGCLGTFRNKKCHCGRLLNTEIYPTNLTRENGFVKETATFIICDDLYVMPNVFGTFKHVLQMHGINDIGAIEAKIVLIGKMEVVDLLKLSLLSKTPLTDFIFKKKQSLDNSIPGNQSEFGIRKSISSDGVGLIVVKVIVRKSNGEILFAEAKEDFVDFLFSFLTFPLGGVLHMLHGFTSISSIDYLYNSMTGLSSDRYLKSQELKDILVKPQISPEFGVRKQILPIGVAHFPVEFANTKLLKFVDPKSTTGKSSDSAGFARGPFMFMVTDDLVVTPLSSIKVISYLERMKAPLNDLEEKVISIGKKEGLSILKASLTSTSALTNGLNQYITK